MNKILFEHGYALFIGIRYGHWSASVSPLEGTLRDIDDLNNHFIDAKKAAFPPGNIIVLKEEQATTSGVFKALDDLKTLANKDSEASVIIYYSGHGETDGKNNFLVPFDFDLNQWQRLGTFDESKVILSKEFAKKVNEIQAKKSLIILDCCHAESMPVEKGLKKAVLQRNRAAISHNNLIDEIGKGKGRVILTSCEADEKSLDLGTNGLFTQVLLECLNGADNIKKDGWVRLTDMLNFIPSTVSERANKRGHNQSPMFKRIENLSVEDFIICAYDIVQAKGLKTDTLIIQDSLLSNRFNKTDVQKLIDDGNFTEVFVQLDGVSIVEKFQYNRLKKEFMAGIKGIDLIDFADRLKVFVNQLK